MTLVTILIHILGILSAAHAVFSTRTSQGAIAWGLALTTLPYLSLPLYWIFGRTHFHGYREKIQEIANNFPFSQQTIKLIATQQAELPETRKNDFHVLEKINPTPYTKNNHVELLLNGPSTYQAMLQAIRAAQKYIILEFYIIESDEIGFEFQQLLLQKASMGLHITVLYDEVGSMHLKKSYITELKAGGIKISSFNTTSGPSNRFQFNFRNHRKILIVDGNIGFIGGLNIGKEYIGEGPLGYWRDTHIKIQGPAVLALQITAANDWYWATNSILQDLNWDIQAVGNQTALIYPSGPCGQYENCSLLFQQSIVGAKKRLWIASPYFVPDWTTFENLQIAALRGVDVRVLLPAKADHYIVYLASFRYLKAADTAGIKLFRYQKGFLHEKVILIDDDIAAIGTANFDNRSIRLNFEVMSIIIDKPFAQEVAKMFINDFQDSYQTSYADLEKQSLGFKWAVAAARLFNPIL